MESVTDLAFFVMHKHLKGNKAMWQEMDSINLDSCRYITDFGIEMLNDMLDKKIFLQTDFCCGCEKIFKSFFSDTNEKNDIFTSKKFTKCSDTELPLKNFKLLIVNDTEINLTSYLRNQTFETHDANRFCYSYEKIEIEMLDRKDERRIKAKKKESRPASSIYNINVIEVNKVRYILKIKKKL
jgi:hypothetical protein